MDGRYRLRPLLFGQDGTVSTNATIQTPSTNQVPYTTARLSRSQFSYSFPVTPGPKFLRLFFYPAEYPSFPRTDTSFTVQFNQFTLLYSFNASLNANAEDTKTIFREYVVNVYNGERLNLSFTPEQPNSYAFINGIEVFSMPNDLYYTSANNVVTTDTVLETEYRIKVGGLAISPRNDTGLFRNWAGQDEDYLIKQKGPQNNNLPGNTDGKMNITVNPDYVAPKELYRTARDMGTNTTLNKIFNLTWEFSVDSGFYYLTRLHFCELDPNITNVGDWVFSIYIGRKLVENQVDVMSWSQKQKGVAVYKDYTILIPKNDTQKKVNLSLQMHPYESFISSKDKKYSPFLNGLEIFKISWSNNLAKPNPDPVQTRHNNIPAPEGKNISGTRPIIISVFVGVVFAVSLVLLIVYPFLSTTKSTNTQNSSQLSNPCRRFSLFEITTATNNFDDVFIVGVGGFGHVYKGYIDGSSTPVAIKRLRPDFQQGAREFKNEIEMLSQLNHLHLVSLIGYYNDDNEMILVYDFMTRGNLRDHLYNTDNPPLPWKQRLQICIGAARGLHFLHTGTKHVIIHRDVKTTNILLDEKWVAKVSDFGLSRIGPTGISKTHVSTDVKGSFGYLDPDYYTRHRLTEKSDVYSFGVVLFEILCARPPLIHTAEAQQVSLANWARHNYQSGTMSQIVDPTLKGRIAPECFKKFCKIGVSCLLEDRKQRPSIKDVVWMLEYVMRLQESEEQRESATAIVTK